MEGSRCGQNATFYRMPIRDLKDQIARLPEQPGVYLYFNGHGETLYVGKARALRDRVRNYLGAYGTSPRTDALLDEAARLEVIVTDSVVEALALENNLIKQRSPKYNILLRDDKNYPYLQLTTGRGVSARARRAPRRARRPLLRRPVHAGALRAQDHVADAPAVRHPLLQRGDHRRACATVSRVRHQAVHCAVRAGRCARQRSIERRSQHTQAVSRRAERRTAGDPARPHDRGVSGTSGSSRRRSCATRSARSRRCAMRQQKMADRRARHRDVFGLKLGPAGAVVQVFQVRGGKVVERIELVTEFRDPQTGAPGLAGQPADRGMRRAAGGDPAVLRGAHRAARDSLPMPIRTRREALEAGCRSEAGRRVRLLVPQRGEKRGLLDLANRNAQLAYQTRFNENVAAQYDALETLQRVLGLAAVPRRIECFDISTIQGSETVASMVVCEDGRMKRGEYRKFRIRGSRGSVVRDPRLDGLEFATGMKSMRPVDAPVEHRGSGPGSRIPARRSNNDFAAMHEVVLRRYRKLLEHGGPFPDLILIDGGKGQLSAAMRRSRNSAWRTWSRSASRRKKSCCSRAIATSDRARDRTARRCC